MNKLTKIGVSALCGSLAGIVSAQAGELTVSGGATATWTTLSQGTTGNPIGLSTGMTFAGSGELDNGTAVTLTLTHTDQSAYSGGNIKMVTPSMGTFQIGHSGGGVDRWDDKMPTAWEETNGTGLSTGLNTVAGAGRGTNVEWALPADMMPDGLAAYIAWAPASGGAAASDKGVGGDTAGNGSAWDVALSHSSLMDGLEVFAGYSSTERPSQHDGDRTNKVIGATYAISGFTVGYQYSENNYNNVGDNVVSYYEYDAYAVSYSVNDDLSISWGVHKSTQKKTGGGTVELDGESIQLAYSMGGASIKFAETKADDAFYNTAKDHEATTVALTLAF